MDELIKKLPTNFLMVLVLFLLVILLSLMLVGKLTIADKVYKFEINSNNPKITQGSENFVGYEEWADIKNADVVEENGNVSYKNVKLECAKNEVLTGLNFNVGTDHGRGVTTIVSYKAQCGSLSAIK